MPGPRLCHLLSVPLLIALLMTTSAASAAETAIDEVLMVRVDFPNNQGAPLSEAAAQQLVTDSDQFMRDNSNNARGLSPTVTTVIRLPENTSYYNDGTGARIRNDSYPLLTAAGYNILDYDILVYCYSGVSGSWNGLSGSNWVMLRGSSGMRHHVLSHEIGHVYTLGHANRWKVVDGNPVQEGNPSSMSVEYGNAFDVMGGGSSMAHHFNASFKHRIGWITDSDAPQITSSGTYRIHAHDQRDASGLRALRISRGTPEAWEFEYIYWLEYRASINDTLRNGLVVSWQRKPWPGMGVLGGFTNYLLDMTPETSTFNDHPLAVGKTFRDDQGGFSFTVLRRIEGDQPALDVQV
ncbi:MAG: hypothetical protein EA401_03550, partial [Planctomycetota bacterium]